ncbi:CPBP family intramembrane glutamic endopeptidase [Globicatella sanguinis]|uniref:CPBP family intramembrane glutamic endopeptidase n=1 Tax=Globicatella sanguinis TaxID=13076 RepID=UPI002542E6DE|nr:type II CAAX endopeptidase family protein [Globicatella sanguinis]MDK7630013.1 type II CAAX endopeptidase family protein [Globicatella sanguinis]WIK66709.1 type II CAAX endopeptidase family protein [Globicatella sanguinis]WKT56114.1 type II CAAX endopeptidase family protein [Globicatella sanguinis]
MKKHRNKIMFFGFFINMILFGVLGASGVIDMYTSTALSSITNVMLALFLFGDHLKEEWARFKTQTTVKKILWLSFLLFIINVFARTILMTLFEPYLDLESLGMNQQALEEMQTQINPLLFIFFTVISAPLVEELVFRESLNGWVNKANRGLVVIMWIVSTLLFAGAHVVSLQDFLIYLPLSISLLYMYERFDRNIWGSISFHFVNNALSVILMYLVQLIPQELLEEAATGLIQLFK